MTLTKSGKGSSRLKHRTVRHSAEVRPVGFVINFLAVSYLL